MMSSNMMKPAACFIAVGVASTVLMFPQTLNHLVLNMLCRKALQPIHDALVAHETVLATTPSDVDAWAAATAKVAGLGQAILGAFGQLEPQAKMLQLEISYGRISAGQLKELLNRTRDLGSKTLGLGALAVSHS